MADQKKVAVFFGGRSPEHDVSIISGLQALAAIDSLRYDAFPVYVATDGTWLTGAALRDRKNYLPARAVREKLTPVMLDLNALGRGILRPEKSGFWGAPRPLEFDIALPVFHGAVGEDGGFQGLMATAGIPCAGPQARMAAIAMDKLATKRLLATTGIPLLPQAELRKPEEGLLPPKAVVEAAVRPIGFPAIVKPAHLGSSIGVVPLKSVDELMAVLPTLFRLDRLLLVEPLVPNLVEYNVAVRRSRVGLETSAIEQPKRSDEILDFRQKYMAGGQGGTKTGSSKTGGKTPGQSSEGMLSLTRTLNPSLPAGLEDKIRAWAQIAFTALEGTGCPRLDFLSNAETGECWLNEINPIPGSLGYFLWEAAKTPIGFTRLLTELLAEAESLTDLGLGEDPVPPEARLFPR